MDGLLQDSGLLEGAAQRFLSNKDPRTNHRVFERIACTTIRRIIDTLLECGYLSHDIINPFSSGDKLDFIEEVIQKTKGAVLIDEGPSIEGQPILLNKDFPCDGVRRFGTEIDKAIEMRSKNLGRHKFKHFALDLIMKTLIPCIMLSPFVKSTSNYAKKRNVYAFGIRIFLYRQGQLSPSNAFYLLEFHCAPQAVRQALQNPEFCATKLSGRNQLGNVEKDAALEDTGVNTNLYFAKSYVSKKYIRSIRKSFYTSGSLSASLDGLREDIRRATHTEEL